MNELQETLMDVVLEVYKRKYQGSDIEEIKRVIENDLSM